MAEAETKKTEAEAEAAQRSQPAIHVAPSPHLPSGSGATSTRWMMLDVLIALMPVVLMAFYVFHWYVLKQVAICVVACLAAEAAFMAWRGKSVSIGDCSAAVTGVILGLSLPWSAPWYTGVVAGGVAIGLGKVIYGGLGQNIFNPAMVGRAFAMLCFPAALGAAAYQLDGAALDVITRATPLTAAKQLGQSTSLWPLFIGNVNGSLGETSALACLIGGLYLCVRRTASWEIPAGVLLSVAALGIIADLLKPGEWTFAHHLLGGALIFGAFFIATDPVSSPLTPKGKWIFGAGVGFFVMLIRLFSGYPEGVMFAVLLMNTAVPLINRGTIPRPVGGPVPAKV
jgi:electron transport complex protein RnfD